MYKGIIFDLDGVIVDTAKYHFLAWRRLAEELGVEFTLEDNELLKGVSRMASLDIILKKGKVLLTEDEKIELATKKNEWYKDFLKEMEQDEVLPGIMNLLKELKEKGVKVSLGSASKNAPFILEKLDLVQYFDAVVDGNSVSKAKPDPEVFLIAAGKLGLEKEECIVVEDAAAGVTAAKAADMLAIGIGEEDILGHADVVLSGTELLQDEVIKHLVI